MFETRPNTAALSGMVIDQRKISILHPTVAED